MSIEENDKVQAPIEESDDKYKKEVDEVIDKLTEKSDSLRKTVISKEEFDKKLEEIKEEAKKTKEELVQKADILRSEAKERFQARLNTLNQLINFKASIWDGTSWDGGVSATDSEKWFFWKIWEWFWDQRKWVTSGEEWKNAPLKNGLRAVWWVWLIWWIVWLWSKIFGDNIDYAAVIEWYEEMNDTQKAEAIRKYYSDNIEWYENMTDSEKRKARRKLGKELKKAEREKKRAERKNKFWNSGFWTFLKWLWVVSLLGWWGYLLKKWIDKRKEKSIENKMWDLRWFEDSCKKLKDRADECLKASDHMATEESVKKDYDKIVEDVVILQNDASKISDEISKSKASNEIKVEAVHLMEAIDDYVDDIKSIKDKIYKTDPIPFYDPSKSEVIPEPEVLKPVNGAVLTKAAIDYVNDVEKKVMEDLSDADKASLEHKRGNVVKDIEKVLTNYFNNHQILKKNKSKEMVFEIDDTAAFSGMIKGIFDKLPDLLKNKIPESFRNGTDDIAKTLEEVDAETYKDIIFKYFWSFVANAVKSENWTMTVQTYYDGISKVFPNSNVSQVENDLAASGQADKDIKDMDYPFVVSVNDQNN